MLDFKKRGSWMGRLILVFIVFVTTLFASQTELLKKNKQDIIKQKQKEIEFNTQKLKYNWISPLNISTSLSKSDIYNKAVSDASINLNQDVFRSGGIFYRLKYADVKLKYDLTSLAKQNSSLYENLFIGLLNLKKLNFSLNQTHYNLLNSDIEVFLKTQQYKTGEADITELNRALREKNSVLKTELIAKLAIVEKEIELKKLTDMPLSEIVLPQFELMTQDEYEKLNYSLNEARLNLEVSNEEHKILRSNYLPAISINGAYGYRDNPNLNIDGDYYQVGIALNMPLDYNEKATLEEQKAAKMRKKLEIIDTQINELSVYEQRNSKIKNYQEHNEVTKKNIELYSELIEIIQKALDAGLKTGYDLQTLQNTKAVDELEIGINEINIQIELAQLLFATYKGESYHEQYK